MTLTRILLALGWLGLATCLAAAEPGKVFTDFKTSLSPTEQAQLAPVLARGQDGMILTEAVMALSPDLVRGLNALNADQLPEAEGALDNAAAHANPFVATQARWTQVRLLIRQERFEAALTLLQTLQAKHLDQAAQPDEWQLMHGLLLAYLLERQPAITALSSYLKDFPQAQEGRRQLAQRVLAGLSKYPEETLIEVRDLMADGRRRLALEDSAELTCQRQERIVAVLDVLIEKSQEGGGGGGGGGGSGSGPPMAGAGAGGQTGGLGDGAKQSSLRDDAGGIGSLESGDGPGDSGNWAKAYAKEREAVLSELQSRFPERYRDLIEQYYKSLQAPDAP